MTRSAPVSVLAPEFDDFLFAPIGEDRNGMLLSVVSALARLDVDPWQEAANLARLPGATATRRLASLIAALPDRPSAHLDPGTIAAPLIARLPQPAGSTVPLRQTLRRVGAARNSLPLIFVIFIVMAFVLVGIGILVSGQSTTSATNAGAPASDTVIPQIPSPGFGR
jgi:hypothetical protein